MNTFYKLLLQAAYVFILYWIFGVVLGKHETWVFPEIEGVVVQLEDETLPIAGMEVIARNPEVGDRRATTDESGRFSFPAKIRMRRALGDQCYSTQVSVTDFNETVVTFDALICNAELAVSKPPTKYTLTFRLATKHSVEASRVDGIWQRAGSRGIAVGSQKEEEIPSQFGYSK